MIVQNNFIYKLTDRIGTLDVFPLGENSFSIEYSKDDKDSNNSYKKQLSGKMTFVGDAFHRLMEMESSVYRCDEQVIEISKKCNTGNKVVFLGRISLNEAEFNLDKCFIVVKFMKDDSEKCFNDNKSNKINIMPLVNKFVVKTYSENSVLETKKCNSIERGDSLIYWCGVQLPEQGNWTCIEATASSVDGIRHRRSSTWVREIITTDCDQVGETDWVLVQNCTGGVRKFAKKVDVYNCRSTGNDFDEVYQYKYNCDILGFNSNSGTFDNAMKFKDVMIQLLQSVCPGLTMKSNFFQINPDEATSINYVTNKKSIVDEIFVFQKSDVKRPNNSGNAWKLEISIDNVLENLMKLFNVKWRIVGNEFRIEHITYFNQDVGFDVTSPILQKYFVGNRQFTYQQEKIPKKEIFRFKEASSDDWNVEVIYSGCVSNDSKNENQIAVDNITTDVLFALSNPSSDNKNVTDEGIFLISTRKVGSDFIINSMIQNGFRSLNNVFGFRNLFNEFHKFERPLKNGKVDGVQTDFVSSIRTKKGKTFAIPYLICSEDFNPDKLVKTALGNGVVDSAKLRLKDSMIELELLYESNQDLVPNLAPTISGGGVFETFKNMPIFIDIVASDGDGSVISIQVTRMPMNGILEVISLTELKYTPNVDHVGFDSFSIQAVDNLHELSILENFGITIKENLPNQIANNDSFNVFQGEEFVQPFSLLANDENGLEIQTLTVFSDEGIEINISPLGFFTYVPNPGFIGKDSFNYTVKSIDDQVATATVFLNVTNRNFPVAVDDFYQSSKNTIFTTDGSFGKELLIANDYANDGVSYSFTTTSETKATNHGGSVVIGTDGSFVFTPATDFIGQDSFEYEVNNVHGSSFGMVFISVLPNIFVKLTKDNLSIIGKPVDDYYSKKQDYILNFYSDLSGTIPLDVSGLNFQVKIKENEKLKQNGIEVSNIVNNYYTSNLDGINKKILQNFLFLEKQIFGGTLEELNIDVTIEPSTTYQII